MPNLNFQGFSLFTTFFLYFVGFAAGSYLMNHYGYNFIDVMQVCILCTFSRAGHHKGCMWLL